MELPREAILQRDGQTYAFIARLPARPQLGQVLAENVSSDEVISLASRVIPSYHSLGSGRERLARTIERIGFERFKAAVMGSGSDASA